MARSQPSRSARRRSSIRRARRRLGAWLLELAGPVFLRLVSWSWRLEIRPNDEGDDDPLGPAPVGRLFALWHGRLLLGLWSHAHRGVAVLVSPSGDGTVVKSLLDQVGFHVIRGSSSRGGARAVREMSEAIGQGLHVAITPDGPRGPRHSMNPGLAWMARGLRTEVVPVGLVCDRAWRLRSWDRFTLPKLGARVVAQYGPTLSLDRHADEAEQAAFTQRIHDELVRAELRAFEYLGIEPDH